LPAGAVLNAAELVSNEQLRARGFFLGIKHPETGLRLHCGLPFRLSDTAAPSLRPAPCLGQHNREILRDVLGMNEGQIAVLEEEGAIGTEPIG
jgi:crotonobetainyl-CoA:carnitine CoA-transferase CaiB-like acyl-CoA transferase